MAEYEMIFKEAVYEKLKKKVRGKLSCWVRDNCLHIKVIMMDTKYEHRVDDLANKMLHGLSTELIVYEFCKEYRNYVLSGYFR